MIWNATDPPGDKWHRDRWLDGSSHMGNVTSAARPSGRSYCGRTLDESVTMTDPPVEHRCKGCQ